MGLSHLEGHKIFYGVADRVIWAEIGLELLEKDFVVELPGSLMGTVHDSGFKPSHWGPAKVRKYIQDFSVVIVELSGVCLELQGAQV